jgi:hypothetical protein
MAFCPRGARSGGALGDYRVLDEVLVEGPDIAEDVASTTADSNDPWCGW